MAWYDFVGIPRVWFDGDLFYSGASGGSMYSEYLPLYEQRMATPSNFIIQMELNNVNTSDYNVEASFEMLDGFSDDNLAAFVVLTETDLPATGVDNQHFVARSVWPDATIGYPLDFSSQTSHTINTTVTLEEDYVIENCEVVVFLQNMDTKEVCQGTSLMLTDTSAYDVTFIVNDGVSGNPVENALVYLRGVQQFTNASGETVFTGNYPDIYDYVIAKDGYTPAGGSVEVTTENVTVEVSLQITEGGPTALEFDGVDEYVQTSYAGVFGTDPRTIKAWIYLDASPAGNLCIGDYGWNTAGSRNTFMVNGSGYLAYLSGGSNGGVTATVSTVPIGQWVHVAFVYDGTTGYLYQNGEQVGTGSLTGVSTPIGGSDFRIGQRISGGSIPFKGMIDEVSVWNVALSQQEVIDNACVGNPSQHSNLVAYYKFNEGTGTLLIDQVGGNHGTLLNMEEEAWVDSEVCTDVYNVSFVVTEIPGSEPVENALVEVDGMIQYTSEYGETTFAGFLPGVYGFSVSKDGYDIEMGEIVVTDEDVTVDVEMIILDVPQHELIDVSIYPNPASDVVCISSENTITAVNIYSLSGQLKLRQAASGFKTEVNTSRLDPGVYCIKVFFSSKVINSKLVLE